MVAAGFKAVVHRGAKANAVATQALLDASLQFHQLR